MKYNYNHIDSIYISLVETNPDYRGQRICPKMFEALIDANPNIEMFELTNVGGYSACKCYVNSFQEKGFLFHNTKNFISFCELHYQKPKPTTQKNIKNIRSTNTSSKNISPSTPISDDEDINKLMHVKQRDYMVFTR